MKWIVVVALLVAGCSPSPEPFAFYETGRPVYGELYTVETCPVHDEELSMAQVEMVSGTFYLEPPNYQGARDALFPYARGLVHGAGDGTFHTNRCESCTSAEQAWLKTGGQR